MAVAGPCGFSVCFTFTPARVAKQTATVRVQSRAVNPRTLTAALVVAVATVTSLSTVAHAGDYPPELDGGTPECTLWKGTVSGNDKTVRMMFRLCPAGGDDVSGTGQWSSKVSGYNVRRLSGRWLEQGKRLELRDEAVVEQHPEPGWQFCAIDRYDLVRTGNDLTGTYDSRACNDHATVKVTLVGGEAPAASSGSPSSPPPSAPSTASTAATPTDPKPQSSKSCGCSTPGRPAVPSGELVAGVAALALTIARAASRRR